MRGHVRAFTVLLLKDLRVTARSPWELLAILVFSSLSAIPATLVSVEVLGDATKLVLLFLAIYISTQTYVKEGRAGTIEVYHLYPIAPSVHFLAKLSYTWLLLLSSLTLYTTTLTLLGVPPARLPSLTMEWLPLTLHLSAASSLASLISTYLKAETTLLIAVAAVMVTPALLSKGNPATLALLGLAYTIVALTVAELLED
jgi:ABC-type transport system involved in cytochrome c biogenesis permease component